MASRKPLVLNAGQIEQLQSGDTIDGALTTQFEVEIVEMTNANATVAIPICTPVYVNANGTVDLAKADSANTTKVLGLAREVIPANGAGDVQTEGVIAGTTGQWDTVTGGSGGLTPGTTYYLDPDTAGMLSANAPTVAGDFVAEVGQAIAATKLEITVAKTIKL